MGLAGLAAPAALQARQAAAPRERPTELSGVTVVARRTADLSGVTVTNAACPDPNPTRYPSAQAPRVIDSYPRQGALVAPGLVIVRVTFDAPMACYWAVDSRGGGDDEPCKPTGAWELPGRTTWRMQCKLEPGAEYRIRFGDIDGRNFYGMSGRPAAGFALSFSTSEAAEAQTLAEAEAADPGPPGAPRATAYVACTERRFGAGPPCERKGLAEVGEGEPPAAGSTPP